MYRQVSKICIKIFLIQIKTLAIFSRKLFFNFDQAKSRRQEF